MRSACMSISLYLRGSMGCESYHVIDIHTSDSHTICVPYSVRLYSALCLANHLCMLSIINIHEYLPHVSRHIGRSSNRFCTGFLPMFINAKHTSLLRLLVTNLHTSTLIHIDDSLKIFIDDSICK